MTNEKLYEILGDINEKHINEAKAYHKTIRHYAFHVKTGKPV